MKTFQGVVVMRGYQTVTVEVEDDATPEQVAEALQENFQQSRADWETEATDIEEITK